MLIRIGYFYAHMQLIINRGGVSLSNELTTLTRQESDMITLLINGESITDIAKLIGVHRNTITKWMNKDYIKAEMGKRRQELTNQGNAIILKDLSTYINNIKALANDNSDKRVALAANQYLINRVYGSPTAIVDINNSEADNTATEVNKIEIALSKMKSNHWKK